MCKCELVNWDHEVCPTPVADFIENIKHYLAVMNGYAKSQVTLENGVLTIIGVSVVTRPNGNLVTDGIEVYEELEKQETPQTLCILDFSDKYCPRERYGRASAIGTNVWGLSQLIQTLAK